MLDRIRTLLKSDTTVDLTAALGEINIETLRAALSAAETKRQGLLLTGSDRQVIAAEADVASARLSLDRGSAAKDALEAKLATAKARENDEAFERDRAAVAALCETAKRELKTKLRGPVQEIQRIRRLVSDAEIARVAIYVKMAADPAGETAAGRSSEVPSVLTDLEAEGLPGWALRVIHNSGEVRHES